MANPKGIAVFITGIGQSVQREDFNGSTCRGVEDRTQLDIKAQTRRSEGWVTISVDSDTLGTPTAYLSRSTLSAAVGGVQFLSRTC